MSQTPNPKLKVTRNCPNCRENFKCYKTAPSKYCSGLCYKTRPSEKIYYKFNCAKCGIECSKRFKGKYCSDMCSRAGRRIGRKEHIAPKEPCVACGNLSLSRKSYKKFNPLCSWECFVISILNQCETEKDINSILTFFKINKVV